MTLEELQAQLDELKASNEALDKKNKELLAEKKKAKAEADKAQADAVAAAEEAALASTNVEEIKSTLAKQHQREMDKLNKQLEAANGQLSTLLIDNAARDLLTKHNVPSHFQRILLTAVKAEASLKDGAAMVGDTSLEDYVSSLLTSDEGKHFVAAPVNTGANAGGNTKVVTGLPEQWNFTKYAEMKSQNPELAQAYARKHNQPFAKQAD